MEFLNYKSGPGLDMYALKCIYGVLQKKTDNINILEFGSGFSTQFLIDYKLTKNKNITIDSYDNDKKWCFQEAEKYDFLNLNVEPLISCSDEDFNNQIQNKEYDSTCFKTHVSLPYNHPKYWRQRNCFYNVKNLKNNYDLVIIDGPNGNGRAIAYLHIKDKVKKGSYILVDDHNSRDGDYDYKFVEHLMNIIPVEIVYKHENSKNPSWETGKNFVLFKVL